jgi:polar amino acid transport system permease protein
VPVNEQFLDWTVFAQSLPLLLGEGLGNTLLIAALAILVGLAISSVVTTLLLSRHRWLRAPARVYVAVFRGVPVVLVVMVIGIGLPAAGWRPFGREAFGYAVLAIGLVSGAYVADIVGTGIRSVEPVQVYATRLDGGTALQALRLVVIPQALRQCTPALVAQFVRDVKESSLVYVLGLGLGQRELFFIAQQEVARTNSATPLIAAGACYLAITVPLTFLVGRVMRQHGRRAGRPRTAPLTPTYPGAY